MVHQVSRKPDSAPSFLGCNQKLNQPLDLQRAQIYQQRFVNIAVVICALASTAFFAKACYLYHSPSSKHLLGQIGSKLQYIANGGVDAELCFFGSLGLTFWFLAGRQYIHSNNLKQSEEHTPQPTNS